MARGIFSILFIPHLLVELAVFRTFAIRILYFTIYVNLSFSMRKTILYCTLLALFGTQLDGLATTKRDSLFVYLKSARLEVFPPDVVKSYRKRGGGLEVTLNNDSVITYPSEVFDRLGKAPQQLPDLTAFKFNNKYNDNVYVDVVATRQGNQFKATVPAIGKYLTPSFQLSDPTAQAYIGNKLQQSKVSRNRFDGPLTYTVALPNQYKMTLEKVKDEVWTEGTEAQWITEEVKIQPQQLSTNAPSNYGEDLDNLVDNNPNTFFHSTWGSGAHEKLPLNEHPYIQVDLAEEMDRFILEYTTSHRHDNRFPHEILVQASEDGKRWTDITSLKDGLPQSGLGVNYVSPPIDLKRPYRHLRFELVKASYKNYFVLSRLSVQKVVGEKPAVPPQLVSPAKYAYNWLPYGREVVINVEWPTDQATQVARIDIDLEPGYEANLINKNTYFPATFRLDGGGVFPDMEEKVNIKGRGNSSWNMPKKPYRLKFDTSVKPFGLTKGKSWVLLANALKGSMLCNAVGMKIARMTGTAGANDIIPVELYINGQYRGSYTFTQHVGLHNNSVDVDETNAVLLELDSYYDEPYKFRSAYFNLPVNVKAPDLEELPSTQATAQLSRIRNDFNRLCKTVYSGAKFDQLMDATMLARYLLVNEWILNLELHHPKSTFLYREDLQALHSKYVFGPVWDLDWAYGYETTTNYCMGPTDVDFYNARNGSGMQFFRALRQGSEAVRRASYAEWTRIMKEHREEILNYVDDYFSYARPSLEHNADLWGDGKNYRDIADRFKRWLDERAHYIYSHMEAFDLEEKLPINAGDVNGDGSISLADVVALQHYILGQQTEPIDLQQADVDGNKRINVNDLVHLVALVLQTETDAARWSRLPQAKTALKAERFVAIPGDVATLPLLMEVRGDEPAGLQFDLQLPKDMKLDKVMLPDTWRNMKVQFSQRDDQCYRVVLYGNKGNALPKGTAQIELRLLAQQQIATEERTVNITAATLTDCNGNDQRLTCQPVKFDMEATGVNSTTATDWSVTGGKTLTVRTEHAGSLRIYGLDSRIVRTCQLKPGTNTFDLPTGTYIINGKKVVIHR